MHCNKSVSNVAHMRLHYSAMHPEVPLPEKWVARHAAPSPPPGPTICPGCGLLRHQQHHLKCKLRPLPMCPHCTTPQEVRHVEDCPQHPRMRPGLHGTDEDLPHLVFSCRDPRVVAARATHLPWATHTRKTSPRQASQDDSASQASDDTLTLLGQITDSLRVHPAAVPTAADIHRLISRLGEGDFSLLLFLDAIEGALGPPPPPPLPTPPHTT